MSDVRMAAMDHDLHAVGPAALVAMADDAQVAVRSGIARFMWRTFDNPVRFNGYWATAPGNGTNVRSNC